MYKGKVPRFLLAHVVHAAHITVKAVFYDFLRTFSVFLEIFWNLSGIFRGYPGPFMSIVHAFPEPFN